MKEILIVDDEVDMIEIMGDALAIHGFKVTTAEGGPQAVRHLLGQTAFDFVVSDVHMPHGISGVEVAQEAARLQPQARVILASGYQRAQLPPLPDGVRFLPKPYRIKQLLDLLQD